MAALLNRLGWLGIGVAGAGVVVETALFNGTFCFCVSTQTPPNVFLVEGGRRGVIFDKFRGVSDYVRGEGTHFMIPWVQKPIIYDVRSQPRNIPVVTPSKDLQNVNITLRILYRPEISSLPWIHKVSSKSDDEQSEVSLIFLC